MQSPFGTLLGTPVICGVSVEVYSNGDCHFVSDKKTFDADKKYLGIAYQCVEFVRRFVYLRHGVNLAGRWQEGDACHWYDNRDAMGLSAVSLQHAQEGDILTFRGDKWGHVGIVAGRQGDTLLMTSQNFRNSPDDINFPLAATFFEGGGTVQGASGVEIVFQSVLRF